MSTITIETISPVHIGSGNFLSNNSDFVVYNDEDGFRELCVIDPRKILHFVGTENIDYWVSIIERGGDTRDFMKQKGKGAIPPQYAQRRIAYYSDEIKRNDTLKECLHDGFGRPYIPGSSIKGGIRTAILATLANEMPQAEELVLRSGKTSASSVEKKIFGEDPYSDIFRFLHIGDAYFEKGCEIATRMINLNIRKQENLIDKEKSQIIEAIEIGYNATTKLKIDHKHYQLAAGNWPNRTNPLGKLIDCLSDITSLFTTINNHTLKLVSQEIEYWKNVENDGFLGAKDYIEQMNDVLGLIKNCKKGKECILRIGHASGWRFITGAWSEQFDSFNNEIVSATRRNNRHYEEYDFPKTRRIDEESTIFGFIKLSIK